MPLTESQTRYVNFYTDFAFKKLFGTEAKYTPQERQDYEESLKTFRDWYSVIKTAEKKGHAEGRAEGHAEGRAEGRDERSIEIARGMKADGMPVIIIQKYTGLTAEEIEQL